jgi:geranylgeranylglycerol-phosphate geranylgeranyltransferase
LVRFEYSFFSALAVFLSGILAGDLQSFQVEYIIGFLVVFFSAAGSFAFNDYFDFEADKKNQRLDRPLVAGELPRKVALWIGIFALLLVFLLTNFLSAAAQVLVYISLPVFYLYSLGGKKFLLLKNLLIAGAYVSTILFGSLLSDSFLEPLIIFFALMGFIVGLALEIMLDLADFEGDEKFGVVTLPIRFGPSGTAQISVILFLVTAVLDPLPFFINIDNRLYFDPVFLALITIPVVSYFLISRSLLKDTSPENVLLLKNKVFQVMQIGSIIYLIGVVF